MTVSAAFSLDGLDDWGWFLLLPGKDLIGVQNLLKKHQALQAEIAGHEPRIKAVTQKGNAMVEEGEPWSSGKAALLLFSMSSLFCGGGHELDWTVGLRTISILL